MAFAATLILANGSERELRPPVTIGRSEDNDFRLDSKSVSRHHARITETGGRFFVEDRGSFNGTYLNGTRIQTGIPLPLRHGDRLALGSENLVFSSPSQLTDPERTTAIDGVPALTAPLSPFQAQVVGCLCSQWLAGGSLDELPSNDEIAERLGTPGATETIKAALRRAYAKAGLTTGPPYAKRRSLCRIARQRGWI